MENEDDYYVSSFEIMINEDCMVNSYVMFALDYLGRNKK